MRLSVYGVTDQRTALEQLAKLTQRGALHPAVREAAIAITSECRSRDDMCELKAIYDAVKFGTPAVQGLAKGLRYVADPRWSDYFVAANRILEMCKRGACAGDCDDHAGFIAAMCASLGYKVGLRAWGQKLSELVHVYAVVGFPKREPQEVLGMDTTVDEAHVGWEPPKGEVLTAWLE